MSRGHYEFVDKVVDDNHDLDVGHVAGSDDNDRTAVNMVSLDCHRIGNQCIRVRSCPCHEYGRIACAASMNVAKDV